MNLQEAIARAENGDIDAMVDMAEYIVWDENTKSDVDPELGKKVLEYLDKAIKAGDDRAMNLLGTMYYSGRVLEKDQAKAMEWYQRAADKGNSIFMLNLGYGYYYFKVREARGDYFVEEGLKESRKALEAILKKS